MRPSIDSLKRQAKRLAKTTGCLHSHALDQIAAEHGFSNWSLLSKNWDIESSPESRSGAEKSLAAIRTVMARYPDLTSNGFGMPQTFRKTLVERRAMFDEFRVDMLHENSVGEFDRACKWLAMTKRTKRINKQVNSSYGLKHRVEGYWKRHHPDENHYVANGMFIAAAAHLGFQVKRSTDGVNAYFNIAKKDLPGYPGA